MANDYYEHSPQEIESGTTARANDVNAIGQAMETGVDKLPTEVELKDGTINTSVDSGTANAYVVASTYPIDALRNGQKLDLEPQNTNTTRACTINRDGKGSKSIKRSDGSDPSIGDIVVGNVVSLVYVLSSDTYVIQSSSPKTVSDATDQAGYSEEWATKAEDSLISAEAGGNESTDYSSLHHAAKGSASALAAASSASSASTSATNAGNSETAAASSASGASTSETNAASSASAASTSETNAGNSETAAASSASAASTSETNAGNSETAAASSASAASTSETNAASSASAASTSETNAGTSETNAAASASAASTSETNAGTSETNAAASAASAAAATTFENLDANGDIGGGAAQVPSGDHGHASATTSTEGFVELATQAEVNAGTDTVRALVPDTLAKAVTTFKVWVNFDGTGTIAERDSHNVSSLSDVGTGIYAVNYTINFAAVNYAQFKWGPSQGEDGTPSVSSSGSFASRQNNGTLIDYARVYFAAIGAQ